ncbi:hypothetical protein ACJX0J_016075, partial [Zea mays]
YPQGSLVSLKICALLLIIFLVKVFTCFLFVNLRSEVITLRNEALEKDKILLTLKEKEADAKHIADLEYTLSIQVGLHRFELDEWLRVQKNGGFLQSKEDFVSILATLKVISPEGLAVYKCHMDSILKAHVDQFIAYFPSIFYFLIYQLIREWSEKQKLNNSAFLSIFISDLNMFIDLQKLTILYFINYGYFCISDT